MTEQETHKSDPKGDKSEVLENQDSDSSNETFAQNEPTEKEEIEKLRQEASSNYDKYVRAIADYDNLRRRAQREKENLHKYGLEVLLKELLPVLDSFEKALDLDAKGMSIEGMKKGVELVKKQLFDVLEKHGLTEVDAKGQEFDPNVHQAISRLENDEVSKEIVQEEFVKGYTLHDRLLRPSMVSVAVPNVK